MNVLKPCPFCGSHAVFTVHRRSRYPFIVKCTQCKATAGGTAFSNDGFNAKQWNDRRTW